MAHNTPDPRLPKCWDSPVPHVYADELAGRRTALRHSRRGRTSRMPPVCGRDLKGSKDRAHHRSHRVALLIGIAVMVAAALHLLPLWVAYLIFTVLWVGFAIWSKIHR